MADLFAQLDFNSWFCRSNGSSCVWFTVCV